MFLLAIFIVILARPNQEILIDLAVILGAVTTVIGIMVVSILRAPGQELKEQNDKLKRKVEQLEADNENMRIKTERAKGKSLITGEEEYDQKLSRIVDNIRSSLQYENSSFRDEVALGLDNFQKESLQFSEGIVETDHDTFENKLISRYANAKQSVFATSTVDFVDKVWADEQRAKAILDAHREAICKDTRQPVAVDRIFLFRKKTELSPNRLKTIFDCCRQRHLTGHVFFLEPNGKPENWYRDFVVIDEETPGMFVGETIFGHKNDYVGKWRVTEDAELKELKKSLLRMATPLKEFEKSTNGAGK